MQVLRPTVLRSIALLMLVVAVRPAAADELCRDLLEAFSTLETEAMRPLLATRDVRINLPATDDGRHRALDGRFSGDQAVLLLAERLKHSASVPAPELGPEFLVSRNGRLTCQCPALDVEGGSTFVVLHYGRRVGRDGEIEGGRLYLDLRRGREDAASPWTVRAVRELR